MDKIEELKDWFIHLAMEADYEKDRVAGVGGFMSYSTEEEYKAILAILDAQGKLAEGEYRVGMQGGCHCVFKPDGMILLFGEDDEALVALVASLLNSQGAEIKRLGDANEKFENQEEIIQHLTTAVGNLRDKLTTAQAKVEEFKLLLYSSDMKPTDRLMDKNDKLTAEVASLRESNERKRDRIKGLQKTLDSGVLAKEIERLREALGLAEDIVSEISSCEDGGDLKYIMQDAEDYFTNKKALDGSDNAESDPQDNSGGEG